MSCPAVGVTPHLLLVEDNRADAHLFRMALSGRCTLQVIEDGEQAIQYLHRLGLYAQAPRPSVVVLDLNLPRKSGIEVLASIKQDRQLRGIPVLVLSTAFNPHDVQRCYEAGAAAYLRKPTELDATLHQVEELEHFWFGVVRLPVRQTEQASAQTA